MLENKTNQPTNQLSLFKITVNIDLCTMYV